MSDAWPVGREIHIIVPGLIVNWRRPVEKAKKDGTRYRYTDPTTKSYSGEIKAAAAKTMAGEDPIPKEVGVELDVLGVWAVPSSWSGRKRDGALLGRIHKTTGPDIDNGIVKAAMDSLQGIVYANDAQVVALGRPMKVYGTRQRLEIWVTVAPPMTERDHPKLANKQGTQSPLRNARPPEQGTGLFAAGEGERGEAPDGAAISESIDGARPRD